MPGSTNHNQQILEYAQIKSRLISIRDQLTALEETTVDLPTLFNLVDDAKISVKAGLVLLKIRGY